jgi:hypothetical protein
MNILNLKPKPVAAATPAADALATNKQSRAEAQALYQELARKDTAAQQTVNAQLAGANQLAASRLRRLDLLAKNELGAANQPDIDQCERDIAKDVTDLSMVAESAAVAERKRALLKPQIQAAREAIAKLDGELLGVQHAALLERLQIAAPAYEAAQTAFLKIWCDLIAPALAADMLHVPGCAPTAARFAVRDLIVPLPNTIRACEADRGELFKTIAAQSDKLLQELAS